MSMKFKFVKRQLRGKHFHIEEKRKIRKNNPHLFFYLMNENGQICTNINSHFSIHPDQDMISDNILSSMSEQLKFERMSDFKDYINCDKSYQWYLSYLHDIGVTTS